MLVLSCEILVDLCLGRRTVDVAGVVANNLLDGTLGLEVGEGAAGEGAVDLQAIDKDGDGDEAVGLDLLVEALLEGLVKDDGVDGLVLHCSAYLGQRLFQFTSYVFVCSLRSFGGLSCAFRCSFMCVCDAPGGWRRRMEIAYPCPWTTSSFVFQREPF